MAVVFQTPDLPQKTKCSYIRQMCDGSVATNPELLRWFIGLLRFLSLFSVDYFGFGF
jgi:hypothetical protein